MKIRLRPPIFLTLFFTLLGVMAASPLSAGTRPAKDRSIDIGLMGGYGHAETRGGMIDLQAEILFSLAPSFRLGLGFGYLSDSNQMHGPGNGGMMDGMMGGMIGGHGGISMGFDHRFQSTPLTLTAYLRRPLIQDLDVFLLGGVGYYWSSYRDITVQRKQAFGPHFGLGADLRIARNVLIVGEASYRFVSFKGLRADPHPGFDLDDQGHYMDGFWYFDQRDGRFHFHEDDGLREEFMKDLPPFDISLNGFSLRAGLRFGF